MKICFTQEEVEAIVLAHVQKFYAEANTATISSYRTDFCTVAYEAPEEPAATAAVVAIDAQAA